MGPREGHGGRAGPRPSGDSGSSGNRGRGLIRGRRGFSFGAVDVRVVDQTEGGMGDGGGDRGNNSGYYGGVGRGGGRGGASMRSLGGYYKKSGNYYCFRLFLVFFLIFSPSKIRIVVNFISLLGKIRL
jgi:hypothetical protein